MVSIHPEWENIDWFHNKPTDGERYIAKYLHSSLSDECEIYVQPFLNGSRPDIELHLIPTQTKLIDFDSY